MVFNQQIHRINKKGIDSLVIKLLKDNYNFDQWLLYMFGYYDEIEHAFQYYECIKVIILIIFNRVVNRKPFSVSK